MSSNDIAIKVENISKLYRIGKKRERYDNFAATLLNFIKSPVKNYQKYRSLYNFDDITLNQIQNSKDLPSDIILAVNDVSFSVSQGEVLGIIGKNGAGKSTLLKILCQITDPTTGHAKIHGRVSSLLEVGTGFHQELTGRENTYLNGTILGMTKKEVDRKFDEIVDFSGVEKFIDTPVKRFSSGMKVRLAFSVAAHLEPEILLIDEVLAVGDVEFQKKCLNKMQDVGQQGRTILFVSHNIPAITRLCERVILIDEGMIVEDGPSSQVVRTHISSGVKTTAARQWRDPAKAPGGHVAHLNLLRVCQADGQVAEEVDMDRPIEIEMEYEVLEPGHVLLPHLSLWTENGQLAFVTLENDAAWRRTPRQKGRYMSMVSIPANFLNDGMYYVNCNCLIRNPDRVEFAAPSAIAFYVSDSFSDDSARGDFAGQLQGVVRPLLDWTTELISN